jgi:hypothetical protein
MGSRFPARLAAGTAALFAGLVLASCGESGPGATNPSHPTAACTVQAVMVPIAANFDTADIQASVAANNGDLRCASGIARITVLIGAVNAPSDGPQGSPHLVLLQDQSGRWVIANALLCTSTGDTATPIPAALGDVCGVQ